MGWVGGLTFKRIFSEEINELYKTLVDSILGLQENYANWELSGTFVILASKQKSLVNGLEAGSI